jgi:hypothetical protein
VYYAAQDVMEYLMASTGGGAQDSEHRALRAAIHHAYRDVAHARDWLWHVTEAQLPAPEAGSNNKIYILPENVTNVDALIPTDTTRVAAFVTPSEWRRIDSHSATGGNPLYWTLMKSPTRGDRWQLMVAGTPPSAQGFYYTYRRRPTQLRYMGYEAVCRNGTLDATNAAGAVKRYGTAATFPEGLTGVYPYTAQEILGLGGSMVGTPPTGAKTVVSDYLDLSPHMYSALLSCSEMWLARLLGKNVEGTMSVYQKDLRMAMESDTIAPISGRRMGTDRYPEMNSAWFAGTPLSLGYYAPSGPDTGG